MRFICIPLLLLSIMLAGILAGCGGGGASRGSNDGTIGEVTIVLSPKDPDMLLLPGESKLFTATVTGTTNTAVYWYVNNVLQSATGNTFVFYAPSALGTSYTIRAVSQADPSKSDSVTIMVGPPGPPG